MCLLSEACRKKSKCKQKSWFCLAEQGTKWEANYFTAKFFMFSRTISALDHEKFMRKGNLFSIYPFCLFCGKCQALLYQEESLYFMSFYSSLSGIVHFGVFFLLKRCSTFQARIKCKFKSRIMNMIFYSKSHSLLSEDFVTFENYHQTTNVT